MNADPCYIFTDTETTGLDINFSQIIQVGSILTDENFTTEATQDIGSNLLPWVVPSPEAFLVHKKIDCLKGQLQSHYEMMIELRKAWLEWPKGRNSVFITYNGHRFDEELFRRQFYWCLLPSYITNTSGATRLDMMSTLQLVANFFPKSLQLPSFEPGEVSMKLTDWSEANNIEASNAHDALADCYLMLELAKLVESNAPQVWRASLQGASKFGNLNILQSEPFAMMGEIIRRKSFTYPVTFCGQNRKMNNEVAVADLYFDPDELNDLPSLMVAPMTTSSEELPSRVECQFEGSKGYIMVDQIRSVEKFCFIKKLGKLELGVQVNLCDCLQEFFAL